MEVNGDGVLRVGGIAGDTESGKKYKDAPIIENCSVEGTFHVETTGAALSFAGGIAGRAGANVAFLNNGTDVEIYNASKGGNNSAYAGGIVGTTGQKTVIANCYSFGQMTAISPKSTNYGGMAGGLAAMFAGVHLNSYANANVTIGNESSVHKWIGALYGQVTQVVKKDTSKYGYYNADTVQKVNGVTEAAIQAVGTSSSVKVGEIEEIEEKTVQEISSKEFAQVLNKNIPSSEEILSQIGVREQKLKLWEVKNNKIVHGEKYFDDVTINTKIFAKGDGTKENPFVIDTEKQLRNFANSLTEDIDYQGLYISLGDDITLSSEKWIPIGNHEYSFEGYFDGQNHVVSCMAIGTKEEPHNIKNGEVYNGFFSVLGEHAYVKNLHLTNMSINVQYEASSYAGGITGYMNKGGIVDGCSVTGRISNHAKKGNNFAGGIAGYVYKGKIINSYTNVDVSVVTESGNIAEAGGLAALVNRGLVANCYTFGDVYGSADRQQEGMACVSSLVAVNAGALVNCYAMGNNVTDDYSYYTGIVSGWITGIGKSYQCYYNKDSIMKIGSQIPNPIAVVGTVVSAGVNEEGDAYIGGLSAYHKGMTIEEMQGETLANELNKNFDNFTVDVEAFGLNANALRSWYYDKNKNQVVLSDKNSVAKYVRPEVEIVPEKNISYVDGIYYGRDKNKQYVVKVQVEQTKVVTISAIQGNVATCDAIFDEVLKKQKVSGTSALELALEEALSKAELGDDTDYEVLDPSKFAGGLGTKESPYLISNEEELRYLASSVNADVNYKNVYFALVCDITLTKEWKPIGRAFDGGNAYPFEGQFDGRGHVIRNLTIGTEAMPAAMMTTKLQQVFRLLRRRRKL